MLNRLKMVSAALIAITLIVAVPAIAVGPTTEHAASFVGDDGDGLLGGLFGDDDDDAPLLGRLFDGGRDKGVDLHSDVDVDDGTVNVQLESGDQVRNADRSAGDVTHVGLDVDLDDLDDIDLDADLEDLDEVDLDVDLGV